MACARHLNLNKLPIVCINVDGYYEPFREMLEKAYKDELITLLPEDIVHFASSSEEAIQWIELEKLEDRSEESRRQAKSFRRKKSIIKRSSFFSAAPYQDGRSSFFSMMSSFVGDEDDDDNDDENNSKSRGAPKGLWYQMGFTFVAGAALGVVVTKAMQRNR